MSLGRQLDADLWASTQNTQKLGAVPVIVDNTGTVGDVAGATQSWWRSTDTASGSFAAQGKTDMSTLYNTILNQSSADGTPDYVITTRAVFEFYEHSLEPQVRYASVKDGNVGFENLRYKSAPMTFGSNVPSGELYMLRSDNLYLTVHSGANFKTTEFVKPANQDARTAQILLMAEVCTDNRRKLGRLTAITA